ncbi:MAG: hypothetical protein IPO75_03365 [Betaproteobacteria bacterium]|nr:hypothetical protein [Betaproteobacteria bacterium]
MKRFLASLALWLAAAPMALAAGWGAGCIAPITVGQVVNGQLTTSDCAWYFSQTPQHQYYTDVYAFTGTAGQQISILLTSPTLDTFVELYGVNDLGATPLAGDDDGGGGYNARIPPGAGYFTLPANGTYYIWAQTSAPDWTGSYTLTLSGVAAVPGNTPEVVTVTEFHHPQFNHYFITADPGEAASLSAGNLPPWVPTGQTFKVWNAAGNGITNVCRFFNNEFAPRSSHFYSNNPAECPSLASRSRWELELANAFYMMTSPTGTCPAGTVPLYRLYNQGMSLAPNHRYTTFQSVRSTMIAAGWLPEGNGADGVFACVPPGGNAPPPPPASTFQAEVTGYANTVLKLVNGDLVDVDQLTLILGAGIAALEDPTSTCPVATSTPPLAGLETFPPNLTINMSFGSGCVVKDGATQATVAGSVALSVTNLAISETAVSGKLSAAFNNVKINGALVANGSVEATLNLGIGPSLETVAGTVAVTLNNFQLPNDLGFTGTANIALNVPGTTMVVTNLTSGKGVVIKLNAAIAPQADGSVLVNTSGSNTVGAYTVQANNLRIDAEVCETGPIGGSLSFSKGGQTGTLTFNSSCTYTYSGP